MPYLAYDVRGIQSFLFAIPKLRSIIGGSALVDRFDRDTIPELARRHGWDLVHSGGGRGLFRFERGEDAETIIRRLVEEARHIGVDVRIGRSASLLDATHCADALFPFLPDRLDGHPCTLSGLYPVSGPDGVHPVVKRRHFDRGDRMDRWFESVVLDGRDGQSPLELHPALRGDPTFFREVQDDAEGGSEAGRAGLEALGGKRRWAVICMDGNDIGRQFAAMSNTNLPEHELAAWARRAGLAIDDCGTTAFRKATEHVLRAWIGDIGHEDVPRCDGQVVLPIRPLVLGGDDLALLCHPRYAARFVIEASRVFTATSRMHAAKSRQPLWPVGEALTISAAILYAPSSLPLSSAIPYTENLLAMAKRAGRRGATKTSPAFVEWESVTETMLDRPEQRRQRELVFRDLDLGGEEVRLSQRPMPMSDFESMQKDVVDLEHVPLSILHRLGEGLRVPAFERQVFVNRLKKNHPEMADGLREPDPDAKKGKEAFGKYWHQAGAVRSTKLLDLVGLILEERRAGEEVRS